MLCLNWLLVIPCLATVSVELFRSLPLPDDAPDQIGMQMMTANHYEPAGRFTKPPPAHQTPLRIASCAGSGKSCSDKVNKSLTEIGRESGNAGHMGQ